MRVLGTAVVVLTLLACAYVGWASLAEVFR